jgi:deazaflavin-dependent oxidoreductase (nitroreductase family)
MPIQPSHRDALTRIRTVDFTTIGRKSGEPRTIEIWWFHVDGRFVITGTPGQRDWLANVRENPEVTISTPLGDFPATAVEIDDHAFRRRVFTHPEVSWYSTQAELDHLVVDAPMVEIHLD